MKITIERIIEAVGSDNNQGFCKACGEDAFGVEPDARNYECESCGEHEVFGVEELMFEYYKPTNHI